MAGTVSVFPTPGTPPPEFLLNPLILIPLVLPSFAAAPAAPAVRKDGAVPAAA